MHAFLRERAQEHRECGHKGLSFTGRHFGDFALVQNHTANELHIVVHHVPSDFIAACEPFVLPDGLVAIDGHEVASLGGKVAVHFGGGHLHCFVGGETCCRFAHGGEHDREVRVELFFKGVENVFLVFVNFVPKWLAFVEGEVFHLGADFGCCIFIGFDGCGYFSAHLVDFAAKLIVGKCFERWAYCVDFVYDRLDFLEVALRLVPKEFA